ncbi:MAG TPA: 2-oxoacid:acceptor oxidoreductase family protein, partial [Candidatus Cryosericum sp.]|nr:2-oxoacid:acceptor oxidoreductase family protein [Candidatus Cryosericum sp.]
QSFDKFEPAVEKGGLLVVDATLIDRKSERSDITCVYIPATDIALQLGNSKFTNMVLLGAYLGKANPIPVESALAALPVFLTGKKASLVEVNKRAIQAGLDFVSKS